MRNRGDAYLLQFQKIVQQSINGKAGDSFYISLRGDVFPVTHDRMYGDIEMVRNLLVYHSLSHTDKNFLLTIGKDSIHRSCHFTTFQGGFLQKDMLVNIGLEGVD